MAVIISRRSFVEGAAGTVALCALGLAGVQSKEPLVRPPGGQDERALLASCIRCGKCAESCPQRVITMGVLENGLINTRTPVLNFESSYCDFCKNEGDGTPLCASACPTGALRIPANVTPQTIVLGVAEINQQSCLSYRDNGCRLCADACPYGAVLVDEDGRVSIAEEHCNGCGLCEATCPSLEYGSVSNLGVGERAIVVRARESERWIDGGTEEGGLE